MTNDKQNRQLQAHEFGFGSDLATSTNGDVSIEINGLTLGSNNVGMGNR